ncbi:MAG: limonene-1,2-epoxide hydrolase family protein [Acidimicrobiales bacterium]
MPEPLDLVLRFCKAWPRLDLDELVAYFSPDSVYHNIPLDPVTGPEAIRATIAGFTSGLRSVEFEVLHYAVADNVVLTERVDRFISDDRVIALPVMGVFEIHDELISAWRDYFDLNQFMSQMASD